MLLTTQNSITISAKLKNLIIFVLFLLFSFISKGQLNSNVSNCIRSLQDYKNSQFIEKVYLHSDKSIYSAGESIWFSIYLMDRNNKPISNNTIVYVELISNIDNKVISQRNIQLINGLGNGDIYLPDNTFKGDYLIRAFTMNMKNFDHDFFFHKQIAIHSSQTVFHDLPTTQEKKEIGIDVQFFPEGGDLIFGFPTIIAFKAINQFGKGISLEGKIINSKGDSVEYFKTAHLGMGKFILNPQKGKRYTAVCTYNGNKYKFKLPKVVPEGYKMSVRNSINSIYVTVECTNKDKIKNSYIIGQSRGEIFSIHEMRKGNNYFHFSIPKDSLPHGIAQFTFFNSDGSARCERLVFVENETETEYITISTDKKKYDPKEKVKLKLDLTKDIAKSDLKNLSLSVVASDYSNLENKNINIRNYFLLSSEIKGNIENPSYYFNPDQKDRTVALDLLMLTQGWRRFNWDTIIEHQYPPIKYYPEEGFSFTGQLLDYYQRDKAIIGDVSLMFMEHPLNDKTIKTDENGFFHFNGYDIMDTLNVFIQADKLRKRKVRNSRTRDAIYINHLKTFPVFTDYDWDINKIMSSNSKSLLNDTTYIYDKESTFIEEVKITRTKPKPINHTLYTNPSHRFSAEDDPTLSSSGNVFTYLRGKVPGVRIKGQFPQEFIELRNSSSISISNSDGALLLIDNMPMMDQSALYSISMQDVAYIDILKGASAAIYGSRSSQGVISIHTKLFTGSKTQHMHKKFGIINFKHPGYSKSREFYNPKYDYNSNTSKETDFRTTLYWTPNINLTSEGNYNLEFYTSDIESDYIIQLEGISNNGQTIVSNYRFRSDDSDDFNYTSQNE